MLDVSGISPAEQPLQLRLFRGSLLHFLRDPGDEDDPDSWEYHEDGGLLVADGKVSSYGAWDQVQESLGPTQRETVQIIDYRGKLIVPGFVDTHAHYPQMCVIGSYGRQLLDWLSDYTFPAEATFASREVADAAAMFFLDRMLAHGTTTASVFATVHPQSVDAFFEAADARRLRVLCGKVMMDRNCPDDLRDTAESSLHDSAELIARWHGKGRLLYSVTPRFAPTSTPEQLRFAGELFRSQAGVRLQTHLAENTAEIAWVHELFPDNAGYLDVYGHYGLLGRGAIFGHAIHLEDSERQRLASSDSAVAFCPSSNQFLGSGSFDLKAMRTVGVKVGLASDVGGGTNLSMLRTMASAYQVCQSLHQPLSPWRAWYLATLGGAEALALDSSIGNFAPGKEADFVVLTLEGNAELEFRIGFSRSLGERLFAMMTMGDERCIHATHVLGEAVFTT